MSGNAIVYDGDWGATGEQIDVAYVAPIPEATQYWTATGMTLGKAPVWTDRVSGDQFVAPVSASQNPTVYKSTFKVMRFDGAIQRMDIPKADLANPHTVFIVGRFVNPAPNQWIFTGGQGEGSYNLSIGTDGNFAFRCGQTLNSGVPGDSVNRIFIITVDGENSAMRVNLIDTPGSLGTVTATAIRLGASSTAYFGADIHAMGFIPRALDVTERASLRDKLHEQYLS